MWLPTCLANEPPTTRIPKHGRSLEDGDGTVKVHTMEET